MENSPLKIGTLLHLGAYEILKVLGNGGFGFTYLAHDIFLKKKVAIKEFFPHTLCSRDASSSSLMLSTQNNAEMLELFRKKFIKEARNIAKLSHPNIIKIHSAFEENNTAYYVMDYISGESFQELIKRKGSLPLEDIIRFLKPIGEALGYLHLNKMTHLDVKPANIMLCEDMTTPILIDFGLSRNYDYADMPTTTIGPMGISPGFSPSEQYVLSGTDTFTPKSDIYALGATFYYLLTGLIPPEGPMNDSRQLYFPEGVPLETRNAIIKSMSGEQQNRHASVKDFFDEICQTSLVQRGDITIQLTDNIVTKNNLHNQTNKEKHIGKNVKKRIGIILCVFIAIGIILGVIVFMIEKKSSNNSEPVADSLTEKVSVEDPLESAIASVNQRCPEVIEEGIVVEGYKLEQGNLVCTFSVTSTIYKEILSMQSDFKNIMREDMKSEDPYVILFREKLKASNADFIARIVNENDGSFFDISLSSQEF